MGGIWSTQSNFTKGELDPLIVGRTDLEAYYQGVQKATNVLSIPQGGMKKRPGTKYIATALGNGRLEAFSFNVEQTYLLSFTSLKMEVYKDGVLQTTVTTPYSLARVQEFDFIQSADSIIITHEDVQPRIIQRTSDTAWTINTVSLTNIPQYDFNDASSPTPADEVQVLQFNYRNDGDRFKLSLNGVLTEEVVLSVSDRATTRENIRQALQELPNTGNTGISVANGVDASKYNVTFSGDSADNWDAMVGTPVYTKSTSFEILTTTSSNGTSRKENVWSSTRGWPRTCTFHESRLWFGGSRSRPSTLWGSNVSDVFNFDVGRARADQAIDVTLATDQVNAVNGIISNKSLQVFTSGAEFYIPESPITPENVSVKPQTNLGSKRVRPVALEGLTLFLQRTGKALYQFQYVDEFQSNESRSLSLAAPHLIDNPVQMYVSRGSSESDANYVYLVGSGGDLTVFNTQSFEGVQAFTRWESYGDVKSVAVVEDVLYLLVKRGSSYYIDMAVSSLNTDSAVTATGFTGSTVTGLDHLNGETVKVKVGGAAQTDKVVSSGQITLDRAASNEDVEVGLEFTPEIKTMPFNINLKNGPNSAQKKRILRCAVQMDNSNGVIVNGQRIADKTIGGDQFSAPIPQTDLKRVFLHGWSLDAAVAITQDTPFPLNILALTLEVKV
jgi:hypothetical protein